MALKKSGIESFVQFAMDFIQHSGEESLTYYGKGKKSVKFDEGLITEAELNMKELFQTQLQKNFPGHRIFQGVQEDTDYTHDEDRYLWIYDPLDGAANFQAGIPIWGTSLALFENFWPLFGVFSMPATGDIFSARAGNKALWGDKEIRISGQDNINDESLLLIYSRFHQHYNFLKFPGKIRNMGCTAAHLCYVAMGRAEAAIIANESYQNLAAAWIIIEAAGGKLYKMDGSEFILGEYLHGQKGGERLLAASPDTYKQVRDSLEEVSG